MHYATEEHSRKQDIDHESSQTVRSPLIVYTNAWGLDFSRDWHFPVVDPPSWREFERAWLLWLRAACFSPLDPVPRFPRAWFTGGLERGRRRFTGMMLPRTDRLDRPSYLAAAVLHDPEVSAAPIWQALADKMDAWGSVAREQGRHAADPPEVCDTMRELAGEPWLSHPALAHEAVTAAAEQALDEQGRGWREMLAQMRTVRGGPAEFATTDGERLWQSTPEGEQLGPVDARHLWTMHQAALAQSAKGRKAARRAGFVSLSTHRAALPRNVVASVGRYVDVLAAVAGQRDVATPAPQTDPAKGTTVATAEVAGSAPEAAAAPQASSRSSRRDPQIEAAQRQAIARTLKERRLQHARRRLLRGSLVGLLAVAGLVVLILLISGPGGGERASSNDSAGDEDAFVPDADATPGERLSERLHHYAALEADAARWRTLLTRLTATAETQREVRLAHMLRTAAMALAHGHSEVSPPPEAAPVNEMELQRFINRRATREALAPALQGNDESELDRLAEALRDALPDYNELLANRDE